MKKNIFRATLITAVLVLTSFSEMSTTVVNKNLLGTWQFSVPDAPYQYQKGEIVFTLKEDKVNGIIVIETFQIPLKNLVTKKNKVACNAYIEGELVKFDLEFKKNTFSGTSSYSEGTLTISGIRKEFAN